jgi:hypothetical protein
VGLRLRNSFNTTNNLPQNAGTQIDLAIRDAITDATMVGRVITAANTPRRTGATANSVQANVTGLTGSFGSDSEIFEYLERGTRPHEIRPRFKKALFWPGARHPVKVVQHPGTVALHTLENAGPLAGQRAKENLDDVFREVFD